MNRSRIREKSSAPRLCIQPTRWWWCTIILPVLYRIQFYTAYEPDSPVKAALSALMDAA